MAENNFKLSLPIKKSYTDDNGDYHIALSISTTEQDLYGDIMTEKALESMLKQARGMLINANHKWGLDDIVGVVNDAWIETQNDMSYLWTDVRVRKKWAETVKDLLDSGIPLGGSIEGGVTSFNYNDEGNMIIEDITLSGAALTNIPANKATLGTATQVEAGCPGSLCMQLSKSLNTNKSIGIKMEDDKVSKTEKTKEENDNSVSKVLEKVTEKIDQLSNRLNLYSHEGGIHTREGAKNQTQAHIKSLNKSVQETKEKNLKLERELLHLKVENTKLQNSILKTKENSLIKEALKLNKKLDTNTKIINKEQLFKEMESYSPMDDNKNIHLQLESYNKALELALKKIPAGDLPQITPDTFTKTGDDETYERVVKRNERLNEMGRRRD